MTVERLTSLAALTGTELLTVEFKEKATPRIAERLASMANAQGGLVLLGITYTDRKLVGVKAETMHHAADTLSIRLTLGLRWTGIVTTYAAGPRRPPQ